MNSDDAAAKSDNMMHVHVLEVALDEYRNLTEGISEVITEEVGI
jgi:hypothetical protein